MVFLRVKIHEELPHFSINKKASFFLENYAFSMVFLSTKILEKANLLSRKKDTFCVKTGKTFLSKNMHVKVYLFSDFL